MNNKIETAFSVLVNKVKQQIKRMTVSETAEFLKKNSDTVVIDVREESEWKKGHLPQAIHLSNWLEKCLNSPCEAL